MYLRVYDSRDNSWKSHPSRPYATRSHMRIGPLVVLREYTKYDQHILFSQENIGEYVMGTIGTDVDL